MADRDPSRVLLGQFIAIQLGDIGADLMKFEGRDVFDNAEALKGDHHPSAMIVVNCRT